MAAKSVLNLTQMAFRVISFLFLIHVKHARIRYLFWIYREKIIKFKKYIYSLCIKNLPLNAKCVKFNTFFFSTREWNFSKFFYISFLRIFCWFRKCINYNFNTSFSITWRLRVNKNFIFSGLVMSDSLF